MGSEEEEAYRLARYLDANYILVIFGGVSYYSGDDISKFLWMIRIGGKQSQHDNSLYSWCVPSN
jgi:dolichyl-diphosphooligosaccharide---protein glycosyltransferase